VWCTIGISLSVLLQLVITCIDVGFRMSFVVIAVSYVCTIAFNSTVGSVILTESSRNLPKGSEAGVYTSIAASFNLGSSVSALSGGVISSHFSPSVLVVIDSASTLLLLLTVVLIGKEETGQDVVGERVVEQPAGEDL
jgi:predicted MFS family arabinose efflux permease